MTERRLKQTLWLGPALVVVLLAVVLLLLQALPGQMVSAHQPASPSLAQVSPTTEASANPSTVSLQEPPEGWQTVFSETFEYGTGSRWVITDTSSTDGGEYTWGASRFHPTSPITAAWCVGGGADGSSLTAGLDDYPAHVDSWLISNPIELTKAWEAYLSFNWWMEAGAGHHTGRPGLEATTRRLETVGGAPQHGDWLGWCVLSDPARLESAHCTYVSGVAGAWVRGVIPLDAYVPSAEGITETVAIAFHFISDGDGDVGRGAFVDDIELHVNRGYRVFLPWLPMAASAPKKLLANGGFESRETSQRVLVIRADGGRIEENQVGIGTPSYWLSWYYHDSGTWEQPQVQGLAEASDDVKAYRVREGENAIVLFTSYRKHDAGFLQQVEVKPGMRLRLDAWAHAWSNHGGGPPGHEEDERWSEGAGFDCFYAEEGEVGLSDELRNFTFSVGIDPTGGVDPRAETVAWGTGAHVYNCYHQVPSLEVEAQARRVTVFLRSRTLWPFKHNRAYWDDVELVDVDGEMEDRTWTYPVIAEGSKLGVHSIWRSPVLDYVDEPDASYYTVVKAVDDLGWLTEVEAAHPETVIVARRTSSLEGCPGVEDPSTDLDEMAAGLLSVILNEITLDPSLRGAVDYWEVVNEPAPPGTEGYRRLAELMIKCMERAERHGLRLALFAFNYGTPEWDQMEAMVETGVFGQAKAGGHILTLHEGMPWPDRPIDWGWNQGIPGAPDVPGAGAFCFRYRFLYHLLAQRDEVIPLIISEWYGDQYEVEGGTPQDVVDAVSWYDALAAEDYWVLGLCPFTVGPTSAWIDADYTFAYPALVEYMSELEGRQNGLPLGHVEGK